MTWSERVARMPEVVLVIVAVLASMTVAGLPMCGWVCGGGYLEEQCFGQVCLVNCLPVLIGLLAVSESRSWSGARLLAIAGIGGAVGIVRTLYSNPVDQIPVLAWPLLTSTVVIVALRIETITRRAALRWRPYGT
jgi:hypothetical protein